MHGNFSNEVTLSAVYNYRHDGGTLPVSPLLLAASLSLARFSRGTEIHRAPRRPEAHFQKLTEGRRHEKQVRRGRPGPADRSESVI